MAHIQIIVGSVMGTAQEVAESVGATLEGCGHTLSINNQFAPGQLNDNLEEIILLCTSNTGMGDLPANIVPFYVHLQSDYPAIAGRRYGIITLGDSSYPDFAKAGTTLDEALSDLGAQRLGHPLVLDALSSTDPVDEACQWAMQWEQQL